MAEGARKGDAASRWSAEDAATQDGRSSRCWRAVPLHLSPPATSHWLLSFEGQQEESSASLTLRLVKRDELERHNSARTPAFTATATSPANAACLAAPAYRSIRLPRCDGVCPDAGFSAEVTGVESANGVQSTGVVESTA